MFNKLHIISLNRVTLVVVTLSLLLSVALPNNSSVHAVTDDQRTNLISDDLFVDANSMSVAEIQAFLDGMGGLLADWQDDVDMYRPDTGCLVHKATGMTAAEIIYEASSNWQAQYITNCNTVNYWSPSNTMTTVSPKVILVTLQKEQSLLTATGSYSSNSSAYTTATYPSNEYALVWAMGYGYPDSGGVFEKYRGFYNQVNYGAWQLRYNFERSAGLSDWEGSDNTNYYSGPMIEGTFRRCLGCSLISYDGYYPIDGQSLYMGNRATASLYYYTPHTWPGYNGNYNFVSFYEQWFGAEASYIGKSTRFDEPLIVGDRHFVWLSYRNTGGLTWYEDGYAGTGKPLLELVTAKISMRSSVFGATWLGDQNIANNSFYRVYAPDGVTLATNQHKVAPGYIVRIAFLVSADELLEPGIYKESFRLRLDGEDVPGSLREVEIEVIPHTYEAQFVDKSSVFDRDFVQSSRNLAWVKYQNTGNTAWYDDYAVNGGPGISAFAPAGTEPVYFATAKTALRSSVFGENWGAGQNTPNDVFGVVYKSNGVTKTSNQHVVNPGEIVKVNFMVLTPGDLSLGTYNESLRLMHGSELVGGSLRNYPLNVVAANPATKLHKIVPSKIFSAGERGFYWVEYENTGNATWYDTEGVASLAPSSTLPIQLVTTKPLLRASDFGSLWGSGQNTPSLSFAKVYENNGTTLAKNQDMVLPGQILRMQTLAAAPVDQASGDYREDVRLKYDGGDYLNPLSSFFITIE